MNIDDFKLRTKILIPGALLVLVVFGMVAFSAAKLAAVSGVASDIIERRDMTVIHLARAGRFMFEAPYSAIEALFYDADSPEGRAAAEGFRKAAAGRQSGFDQAMKLAPDRAPKSPSSRSAFRQRSTNRERFWRSVRRVPPCGRAEAQARGTRSIRQGRGLDRQYRRPDARPDRRDGEIRQRAARR